jgi:hypothetical protein
MYVYVTTLFRQGRTRGEKGFFYILDWDTKTVVKKIPNISLRGIARHNGEIVVIDFHKTLKRLDIDSLTLQDIQTYNEIEYPHLIYSRDEKLLVTNTKKDSIGVIESWNFKKNIPLSDKGPAGRLHFNSMGWDLNGDQYHIYNKCKVLTNYSTKTDVVGELSHPHDIAFFDLHRCLVSNSLEREVLLVNTEEKTKKVVAKLPRHPSMPSNMVNFTRGISIDFDRRQAIFGSSPVILHTMDLGTFDVTDKWKLSEDKSESIFDIFIDK